MTVYVRTEEPGDATAVSTVLALAFPPGQERGHAEITMVSRLRADRQAWLPRLSLVAVNDGEIVGTVIGSRLFIDGSPAVALAPLAVHPAHQRQGIGEKLVKRLLGEARTAGETLVLVLGDPEYYNRFGFRPAADLGIVGPYVGESFLALPLAADSPVGRAVYPAAFSGV